MFKEMLENVRVQNPLIHNITNYVTVNDCANILLAAGASPVMADEIDEAEQITSISSGLNINIGTLNQFTIPSMYASAGRANKLGIPIVLDPVGAGASALRTNTALTLIRRIRLTVIRGNLSEIRTLADIISGNNSLVSASAGAPTAEAEPAVQAAASTRGVDVSPRDALSENEGSRLEEAISLARGLAERTGAVIAVSGAVDIVSDANKTYLIRNGHPFMSRVTGTGCMLSALTAAFAAANPDDPLTAAAAAVSMMGLCGEIAHQRLSPADGNASYRNYIIDAVCTLTPEQLEAGARYETR